jgi:hypothetical protein
MVENAKARIEQMHLLQNTSFDISFPQVGFIFAGTQKLWLMFTKYAKLSP